MPRLTKLDEVLFPVTEERLYVFPKRKDGGNPVARLVPDRKAIVNTATQTVLGVVSGGYPWEEVNASRGNVRLQQRHDADGARERYHEEAQPCPKCGASPDALAWFYFKSPGWTWQHLCGRAGWMTVCDACRLQVDFFLEVLN